MRISLPSSLLNSQLRQSVADLQDKIATASTESVTGRYKDMTAHLDGRIGTAMLGEKALADLQLERENTNLMDTRYDLMQTSLGGMYDAASGIEALMATSVASTDQAGKEAAGRDARSALVQAFSSLNARHGERYLFAGDDTGALPLGSVEDLMSAVRTIANSATSTADFEAQIETFFNDPAGGWQSTIYQGAATTSDPNGILAIDPAITDFVSSLAVMALAAPSENLPLLDSNTVIFANAALQLADAQTTVTSLRADLGVTQMQMDRRLDALDTEETILVAAFNELTGRDQYEAAVELEALETNLEASYLLTSRLANLSILNYLR